MLSDILAGEYDDADPVAYENRMQAYRDSHSTLAISDESEDVVFEGGFRVPAAIYNRLFDYQKTGTDAEAPLTEHRCRSQLQVSSDSSRLDDAFQELCSIRRSSISHVIL
jgi:hypothetical protein